MAVAQLFHHVTDGVELRWIHVEGRVRIGQVVDLEGGVLAAHGDVAGCRIHRDLEPFAVDPGVRPCRLQTGVRHIGRHDRHAYVVPVQRKGQFDMVGAVIPLLALYFVGPKAAHLRKAVTEISSAAEAALMAHDWPGNVRELQHAIERAVVVCKAERIEASDLSLGDPAAPAPAAVVDHGLVTLDENERRHIVRVLHETGWRISGAGGAAQLLGVPPSTLRNRMNRLQIRRP